MKVVQAYLGAVAAVVKRDAVIFLSYRARFVTQLLSTFFTLTLFYYVSRLVVVPPFSGPDEYFAFAAVGVIVVQALLSTLGSLPVSVRQELVAGTFERFVLSPFGPVGGIVAMTIFPFCVAVALGTISFVAAVLVFGMPIEVTTAPLAIPVVFLSAAAFAPFAILLAAAVIAVKQAGAGAGFVVSGLALVGGFFFPTELLPSWIRWMSEVQPFTPALSLLRHLLVGAPLGESSWLSGARIAGFALLLFPASVIILRSSIGFAQRRATIIEY